MSTALETAQRIVVKTGSSLVTTADGAPRADWLQRLASDIAALKARGQQVLLVSSGAAALGRSAFGTARRLDAKQAAAAIGQPRLMQSISDAFAPAGLTPAQALLTLEDTERRRRWLNARATLETLLEAGFVPVINENDTVATEEIRYGDNDRLAARVAQMVSADLLILLSDIDGLYTADPNTDDTAEFVAHLTEITPDIEAMAGGANAKSGTGTGGMATKISAAQIAYAAGCACAITLGARDRPLRDLEAGARATWIEPSVSAETARRLWLKGHLLPEGSLSIDEGAVPPWQAAPAFWPLGLSRWPDHLSGGRPSQSKPQTDARSAWVSRPTQQQISAGSQVGERTRSKLFSASCTGQPSSTGTTLC